MEIEKTKTEKGREKRLARLREDAKERGLKETPTEIGPTKRAQKRFRRTKQERSKLQLALFERPEELQKKLEGMDPEKREKVLLARSLMIKKARNKRRNRRSSVLIEPTPFRPNYRKTQKRVDAYWNSKKVKSDVQPVP